MSESVPIDHAPWPARALLLAALGIVIGPVIHLLVESASANLWSEAPLAMAGAAFLAVGGVALALSLERLRWRWSAGFALGVGVVVALVGWWNGAPGEWGAGEGWQFFSSLLATAIALPLFQTARDEGGLRIGPSVALYHAWTNVILWFAAWGFALATFLLVLLLGALFDLIGLSILRTLFDAEWPVWMLVCGAFGGAVGLLRDRDSVVGVLQKVVRAILSVLAPVLAAGLLVFVVALLFTGLEPLWEKTKSTTPIVLVCLLGAVVLINAVIGNSREEEGRAAPLRWSAMALAAVMLPLALVAAVSTAKRIDQYGFTPDRLWALVFVGVAIAFAGAYLAVLVRGRGAWGKMLRRANVRLAVGICLLALFLALPIVSFGAISTRDQVARLEQGRITPDRFDWAALRFDFGPAGRRALERLARSGSPAVRAKASAAVKAQDRWALKAPELTPAERLRRDPPKLVVTPAGAKVPAGLAEAVAMTGRCTVETCRLELGHPEQPILISVPCRNCEIEIDVFARHAIGWTRLKSFAPPPPVRTVDAAGALPTATVEIRAVEKRQVFVDGKPVGPVLN
ncbi:DUF4153 domain-containing protein [Sphingomonas parva]|uniref:DUF4153 domain-containing protein n=1 Tax=Sphingomonas parva TaxID=2555898 RepID=A0A4Y8ZL00_9SPHN|nr:DUF4153 domain-containing protein [Sphingomonas parva]TFI56658.1 DUF4153 domain-containing protein [Sphingomonas parva]